MSASVSAGAGCTSRLSGLIRLSRGRTTRSVGREPSALHEGGEAPVVLSGTFDIEKAKTLRVGHFVFSRYDEGDITTLHTGRLPHHFMHDPRVLDQLVKSYDVIHVLVQWAMMGKTDDMYIAHSGAAAAMNWGPTVEV